MLSYSLHYTTLQMVAGGDSVGGPGGDGTKSAGAGVGGPAGGDRAFPPVPKGGVASIVDRGHPFRMGA